MEAISSILSNVPKDFVSVVTHQDFIVTLMYFLVWKLFKKRHLETAK
jgi:hypothetical protein